MTTVREINPGPPPILPAQPRQTVQIRLDDGRIFEGPLGATLHQFFKKAYPDAEVPILGALVNQRLRELTFQVMTDVDVTPISMADSDGTRMDASLKARSALLYTSFSKKPIPMPRCPSSAPWSTSVCAS